MPKSLISTHCNLKTTDMQFLNRGYVVNKIKEYFTRKMPEEEQNPEFVPKEMVKLSVQTSTMTVDTNRGKPHSSQTTRTRCQKWSSKDGKVSTQCWPSTTENSPSS